jgi:hypothetical protein
MLTSALVVSAIVTQYHSVPIGRGLWAATPINTGSFESSVNSTPTPGTKIIRFLSTGFWAVDEQLELLAATV